MKTSFAEVKIRSFLLTSLLLCMAVVSQAQPLFRTGGAPRILATLSGQYAPPTVNNPLASGGVDSTGVVYVGDCTALGVALRVFPSGADSSNNIRLAVAIRGHYTANPDSGDYYCARDQLTGGTTSTTVDSTTFINSTTAGPGFSGGGCEHIVVIDPKDMLPSAFGSWRRGYGFFIPWISKNGGVKFLGFPYASLRIRVLNNGSNTSNISVKASLVGLSSF